MIIMLYIKIYLLLIKIVIILKNTIENFIRIKIYNFINLMAIVAFKKI